MCFLVAADGQALGQGPALLQGYQDLRPCLAQDGHARQVNYIISRSTSTYLKTQESQMHTGRFFCLLRTRYPSVAGSVPDPNPDTPDPRVFWPPVSGSNSQRYGSGSGSGSGSFYHHAKIIRKILNPSIL